MYFLSGKNLSVPGQVGPSEAIAHPSKNTLLLCLNLSDEKGKEVDVSSKTPFTFAGPQSIFAPIHWLCKPTNSSKRVALRTTGFTE
jgi:hypothetical protein